MSYQISMNNFQTSLLKVSEMDNNHVTLSQTLLKTLWDFFYLSMRKMCLNIDMFSRSCTDDLTMHHIINFFYGYFFYGICLGQFGPISFSTSVFVGFLIGTVTSILDSIGDYYACAKMCNLPPPPAHSVNRGIAIEGFCSLIAGFFRCGHATTTYEGNVGAIGVTKVKIQFY